MRLTKDLKKDILRAYVTKLIWENNLKIRTLLTEYNELLINTADKFINEPMDKQKNSHYLVDKVGKSQLVIRNKGKASFKFEPIPFTSCEKGLETITQNDFSYYLNRFIDELDTKKLTYNSFLLYSTSKSVIVRYQNLILLKYPATAKNIPAKTVNQLSLLKKEVENLEEGMKENSIYVCELLNKTTTVEKLITAWPESRELVNAALEQNTSVALIKPKGLNKLANLP